jgi:hypothetical protein
MRVILKVPLYVSVEVEKNLDRAFVTKVIKEHLIGPLNEYIDESLYFKGRSVRNFNNALGHESKIVIFSESELIRKAAQ